MDRKKKVVIAGGGFGGISAAKGLRKTVYNIAIIDRQVPKTGYLSTNEG
jgi:NADH dehydrogenase FAD-containing subunit